jgi:thiol-disulfide isomerase/thioredoxin
LELIKITSEKTSNPLVLKYINLNFILDEMDANWTSKPYLISLLEKIDFSDVAFQHSPYFNKGIQKIISIASILDSEEDYAFYTKIIKKLFSELNTNTPLKNKVAIYCFKQMESLGYSKACQQLSDIILNGKPILVPTDELYLFESYRKLALGTNAPDFALNFPLSNTNSTLFKTKSKYKLLYFGSSECPACANEWDNLLDFNKKTNKDIEALYISRDENVELFNTHFKNSGLMVHSDFMGWNSKPFLEYAIIVTPSLVLIDNHNKIVYKSSNINAISEWIKNNNNSNTKSNSL